MVKLCSNHYHYVYFLNSSVLLDAPKVKEETADNQIPLDLILQVIRHPAFIATVGGTVWIMLMVAVVYLCQRHSKPYSSKKHSGERPLTRL